MTNKTRPIPPPVPPESEITQVKIKAQLFHKQYENTLANNSFTGVGVGKDNGKYCIMVYLLNDIGKESLPTTFQDVTVILNVTGEITAL